MKIDNAFWTIADSTVEQNDAIHFIQPTGHSISSIAFNCLW